MRPFEVLFDNGNRAALVTTGGKPAEDLAAVGLTADVGRPAVVVCGGAADLTGAALQRAKAILGPAVRSAARSTGAVVVDGGTGVGVMSLMGHARAGYELALPILIGVAPAGRVTVPGSVSRAGAASDDGVLLEQHHSHFVLADSDEWGGETELLVSVAETIAAGAPIAMVIAGGGAVAGAEALVAMARGWPLLVIEGTGGVADSIMLLSKDAGEPSIRRYSGVDPAEFGLQIVAALQAGPKGSPWPERGEDT